MFNEFKEQTMEEKKIFATPISDFLVVVENIYNFLKN
jgi:hypothetical protein